MSQHVRTVPPLGNQVIASGFVVSASPTAQVALGAPGEEPPQVSRP